MPEVKSVKCKVFAHSQRHTGLNVVLVPETLLKQFYEMSQSEPIYVEIVSTSNAVAYGYAWHEHSEHLVHQDGETWVIGLDNSLMDSCLLSEGDVVEVRSVLSNEILPASTLVVKPLRDASSKIQTEADLQFIKNRIIAGENLLRKDIRFVVPIAIAEQTHELVFQVVDGEPRNVPLRCSEKTIIEFNNINLESSASKTSVGFDEVGGLKRQIALLREVIQLPMEHPDVFTSLGISPPKGIILYGPPGNGKTMLARAFANVIKAKFFTINGPELISELAGQGERKLRGVFEKARQNAPSIIFFDEIDSFAGKRDSFASEYEVRMVGQLLSLMDGLSERGNVTIIAATNRLNSIDPALRRPGRFDREIEVTLPSEEERLDILEKYARKINFDSDVDLRVWANKTSGYVGADLAALIREASIRCLRRIFKLSPEGKYERNGDIIVINEDFYQAFKELQPTTFRDLPSVVESKQWHELIGMDKVKDRLINLIEQPLKNLSKLKEINLSPPAGMLLVGKPQSGKKSLVLALAKKLEIQCISARCLDFVIQDRHKSKQSISEIFRKARLASPSIILIERIDLMFSAQIKETRESFIFLEELSSEIRINRLYENVFVVATAHSIENISLNLVEPSVFGHIIHIPLPSMKEREMIVKTKIIDSLLKEETELDYQEVAKITEGLTVGEIFYICEECLRKLLSHGKLSLDDFYESISALNDGKMND